MQRGACTSHSPLAQLAVWQLPLAQRGAADSARHEAQRLAAWSLAQQRIGEREPRPDSAWLAWRVYVAVQRLPRLLPRCAVGPQAQDRWVGLARRRHDAVPGTLRGRSA
jgi:hypothetical protein